MANEITISVGTEVAVALGEPATYDTAGFSALTYTEVGEVSNVPSFGGESQVTEFIPLKTGTVNKRAGSINYGSSTLNVANVFSDAGQQELKSGFDGTNRGKVHSFKLSNPDVGVIYFTAIITSYQYNIGDANTITQAEVALELVNAPITDADVYKVTFTTDGNGTIIGDTEQYIVSGNDSQRVYAEADTNYTFSQWSDANTDNPRTVTNVTADQTLTAEFTTP